MARGGPIQGHRHQILWPEVAHSTLLVPDFMASSGPIQGHRDHILWPEVGLFNAISARFYGQWWAHPIFYDKRWAHPRPSVPYFMASGGPIQGHRDHILWPVVGPFKAIGTMICGPIRGHRHRILWP